MVLKGCSVSFQPLLWPPPHHHTQDLMTIFCGALFISLTVWFFERLQAQFFLYQAQIKLLESLYSLPDPVSLIVSKRFDLNYWNNNKMNVLQWKHKTSHSLTCPAAVVSVWPIVKTRHGCQWRGQGWAKRNWHSSPSLGGGGKQEVCEWQNPQSPSVGELPALAAERRKGRTVCPHHHQLSTTGLWAENPKGHRNICSFFFPPTHSYIIT